MACRGLPPDILAQPVIAQGNPGLILVRTACRADDLLVIGTGRRDAVSRLWHGGVSRYSLAHARCPVLAIPPDRSVLACSGLRGRAYHRRVLFFGVLGALVMRAAFIADGAALLDRFHLGLYVFGAFLLVGAWRMLRSRGRHSGPGRGRAIALIRRVIPAVDVYHGSWCAGRAGSQ
jgi:hypothetical protein